jgi:hypothetical protein
MTVRLSKQPAPLTRPLNGSSTQSTAKPEAAPRQQASIKNGLETAQSGGKAVDRFETRAPGSEASGRIRERLGGSGTGTTVGGQQLPESQQKPWNRETYGEKIERNREIYEGVFDRLPSGNEPWNQETYGEKFERNQQSTGGELPPGTEIDFGGNNPTTVGGHPIPEHRQEPWNQETYGEKLERNRDIFSRIFG